MKHRLVFNSLPLLALILALSPTALASTKWYVDGVNGSDNNNCKSAQTACKTIGHAISLAHSGDSIMVAAATYTENLSIGISLKIVGSSAKTTIVDGGGVDRVVAIPNQSAHVRLSNLTMRNGAGQLTGGGIYNKGTLAINNSTISGNVSSFSYTFGGGVSNLGTLTINNSTISGNAAHGNRNAAGGGIGSSGPLTINNSTISGNTANSNNRAAGGGISSSGPLTINNSTISGNTAKGISFSQGGGIINTGGIATFQNSILANNSGGNCAGTMTSKGYNLSSDGTCNFNNSGDLNNTDPRLGQLGNYGGLTQTIPLLSGSPAIDAGNPNGCTDGNRHLLKTDQRGKPRPDKEDSGGCDMGAFERQSD
jgi:hypothetical protein